MKLIEKLSLKVSKWHMKRRGMNFKYDIYDDEYQEINLKPCQVSFSIYCKRYFVLFLRTENNIECFRISTKLFRALYSSFKSSDDLIFESEDEHVDSD